MRKTGGRVTSTSGGALAMDPLIAHLEEGNVQVHTLVLTKRQRHKHGGRGKHRMVWATGDWMPYPPPPNFPPPPPLAYLDETSLGS